MPRPKVKPQDRVRSVRACDACKISKKRCDGALPCILCSRKGLARTCAYTAPRRRRLLSPPAVPEAESMSVEVNLSPILTTSSGGNCPSVDVLMALDETPGEQLPSLQPELPPVHSGSMTNATGDGCPVMHSNPRPQAPATPTQKPVMLSCSTGEKGMFIRFSFFSPFFVLNKRKTWKLVPSTRHVVSKNSFYHMLNMALHI